MNQAHELGPRDLPEGEDAGAQFVMRNHLLWSFVATLILTTILRMGQALGYTRMDIPLMLGTMVSADRDKAKVQGALLHLLNGWIFGAVYVSAFHSWRHAGLVTGALIGLVHGLVVLVVGLPLLPGAHRRMASDFTGPQPTTSLEPPGFLALNYGRSTPALTLAAHVVYGAILGSFYRVPKQR
jgi:xanthine/uracil permease